MKKITLYTILALTLVMLAGCKKKDIVLTADHVKTNVVAVKKDGSVQAATVEEFTKDYYNLTELEDFITKQINDFNADAGKEVVTKKDLEVLDNNAVLILNYESIEQYASFNNIDAVNDKISTVMAKSADLGLPDVYVSAKDGAFVNADVAAKHEDYKILIINEPIEIQLEGDIKYYSNATLEDDSKVQAGTEGPAIIIYKPW